MHWVTSRPTDVTSLHKRFKSAPETWMRQFWLVAVPCHVRLFATLRTAAHQASVPISNSRSLLKVMSIEVAMTSNHLILCHPLLFLPSVFHSIRVFSNESVLHIRWPKLWSFSFSISPLNKYSGLISFRLTIGSPCSPRDSQKSSPTLQDKSINSSALSFL